MIKCKSFAAFLPYALSRSLRRYLREVVFFLWNVSGGAVVVVVVVVVELSSFPLTLYPEAPPCGHHDLLSHPQSSRELSNVLGVYVKVIVVVFGSCFPSLEPVGRFWCCAFCPFCYHHHLLPHSLIKLIVFTPVSPPSLLPPPPLLLQFFSL